MRFTIRKQVFTPKWQPGVYLDTFLFSLSEEDITKDVIVYIQKNIKGEKILVETDRDDRIWVDIPKLSRGFYERLL